MPKVSFINRATKNIITYIMVAWSDLDGPLVRKLIAAGRITDPAVDSNQLLLGLRKGRRKALRRVQ
jgi:hypothetical protein